MGLIANVFALKQRHPVSATFYAVQHPTYVLDSILLGLANSTESEFQEAVMRANIPDPINLLHKGFHVVLSERVKSLSCGQHSCIEINRAFFISHRY